MKQKDKLRAYWSKKEKDIMLHSPLGIQTKCDGHYLSGVFNKEFIKEMGERGYDITTVKFSIESMKGDEKFTSQRTIVQDNNLQNGENKKKMKKIFVGLSDHEPEKDGWVWVEED